MFYEGKKATQKRLQMIKRTQSNSNTTFAAVLFLKMQYILEHLYVQNIEMKTKMFFLQVIFKIIRQHSIQFW